MAGLKYWEAGSDVYRYLGDKVVTSDDVLSPFAHCYMSFLRLPV